MAHAAVMHEERAGTVCCGEVSGARAAYAEGVGEGDYEGDDYARILEGRFERCHGSVADLGDAG